MQLQRIKDITLNISKSVRHALWFGNCVTLSLGLPSETGPFAVSVGQDQTA